MIARMVVVAVLGGSVSGCEPKFDRYELYEDPDASTEASIGPALVEVPVGSVAVAITELHSKTREDYDDTALELRSQDPDVLEVAPGDASDRWIFLGRAVGETCIEVSVDNEPIDCIDARVVLR